MKICRHRYIARYGKPWWRSSKLHC